MKIIKNNAVLSFQLDNTAHRMHKHQSKSMPALDGKRSDWISFSNFEGHFVAHFLDISFSCVTAQKFGSELRTILVYLPQFLRSDGIRLMNLVSVLRRSGVRYG